MQLSPPKHWQAHDDTRPSVNSRVNIIDPDQPQTEWPFFIRIRLADYDLALPGQFNRDTAFDSRMVLRQGGRVLQFGVHLEPLDGPLAMWRVFYTGEKEVREERREWRNAIDNIDGRVRLPTMSWDHMVDTVTYDFTTQSMNFFLPWPLERDEQVETRWTLDYAVVEGTVKILRRNPAAVWWHRTSGFQAVGLWDDFANEAMAYEWRMYCWRHQHHAEQGG